MLSPEVQAYSLVGLAIVLTIKEAFNSNGRGKLHKRIDQVYGHLEERHITKDLCDERSGNIEKKLDTIEGDVKELLRRDSGTGKQ